MMRPAALEVEDLPWGIIESIPHTTEQMWQFMAICVGVLGIVSGTFAGFCWVFLGMLAWSWGWQALATISFATISVLLLLGVVCSSKYPWCRHQFWQQECANLWPLSLTGTVADTFAPRNGI